MKYDGLLGTGGRQLSYDFYLHGYNVLLEIQGQQHYHPVDFGGKGIEYAKKQFEKQKIHDKLKSDYARLHNIQLLEILYWDFDNIEQIIKNYLSKIA